MSSPGSFDALEARVANLAPVFRKPLDSPYEISNELFAALRHVLHDVGGQPDLPVPFTEKIEEPWEMNTYVTCECLGWRGAWNAEERRRAENDLGATLYFGLPYYARWATVAAKVLINKGLIIPDALSAKIDEVRDRRPRDREERHHHVSHPHAGLRPRQDRRHRRSSAGMGDPGGRGSRSTDARVTRGRNTARHTTNHR
jgi:thiocyanate hydrolase subunit beta